MENVDVTAKPAADVATIERDVDLTRRIKQSNRLVEANYSLTDREQRFILLFISQLDKNSPDIARIELPVRQIAENLSLNNDWGEVLQDTCRSVMERVLTLYDKHEGWYMTHWIQSVNYNVRKQTISVLFDKKLKADLLQLKAAYVSADTSLCLQFKGKYTARLYMLIRQYLKIGSRVLTFDFLVKTFQLGGNYLKRVSAIKERVIEPALAQIQQKSDITFAYEYLSEGRRVTAVKVEHIKEKNYAPEQVAEPVQEQKQGQKQGQLDFRESLIDKLGNNDKIRVETDSNYDGLVSLGIYPIIARKIIASYDKELIAANIAYTKNTKNVANKGGFVLAAIADDFASQAAEVDRVKKEERERERQKIKERLEAAEVMKNINVGIASAADGEEVHNKIRDWITRMSN